MSFNSSRKEKAVKFLIVTKQKFPVPPEHALALIDAFSAYIRKYKASGHLEAEWSFSGSQGGGAVVNVDTLEELDAIIAEFPLGPFSEVEVYPLVDLEDSIARTKQMIQTRMQQMAV